ncbi:hypothetical protein [Duganella sp. BJB1802]|uniref:hypothetical protein n=1 Tax=Duganella sp. BJB1802 TaxID=2744575 RepID=UPI001C3DFC87|nr:hypothetical protein [Duganella sp. BJB1802]
MKKVWVFFSKTAPVVVDAGEANSAEAIVTRVSSKPEWLKRLDEGNAFNAERASEYPYNEVYINNPKGAGYTRLDSYNPISGEIVSRKFTQFSEPILDAAHRAGVVIRDIKGKIY